MTFLVAAVLAVAPSTPHIGGCQKRFTYRMDTRAADVIYRGTRDVSHHQRRRLDRIARCQRHHDNVRRARRYNHQSRLAWAQRRLDATMQPAVASWYDLHGGGACGVDDVQNGYRFASLNLPCGARIHICGYAGCADAQMADRGPYVGGRTFDLNVNLRDAVGCPGVCEVRWRQLR